MAASRPSQPFSFTLRNGRKLTFEGPGDTSSKKYPYAARDLVSATCVTGCLPAGVAIENDTTYLARLRKQHGRKYGFGALIDQKAH
jgi:hypothetical protein